MGRQGWLQGPALWQFNHWAGGQMNVVKDNYPKGTWYLMPFGENTITVNGYDIRYSAGSVDIADLPTGSYGGLASASESIIFVQEGGSLKEYPKGAFTSQMYNELSRKPGKCYVVYIYLNGGMTAPFNQLGAGYSDFVRQVARQIANLSSNPELITFSGGAMSWYKIMRDKVAEYFVPTSFTPEFEWPSHGAYNLNTESQVVPGSIQFNVTYRHLLEPRYQVILEAPVATTPDMWCVGPDYSDPTIIQEASAGFPNQLFVGFSKTPITWS